MLAGTTPVLAFPAAPLRFAGGMKWVLAALAVLALATAFVMRERAAVKTSYVNGLTAYSKLPGRMYILQRDCYIFKLDRHETSYPLIGTHDVVPELPEKVTAVTEATVVPGARLLDTLKTGTRFQIVSVRRDESRAGTNITLEVLLEDEANRKYPRLDTFFILDHAPEAQGAAPLLRPDFAAEHAAN